MNKLKILELDNMEKITSKLIRELLEDPNNLNYKVEDMNLDNPGVNFWYIGLNVMEANEIYNTAKLICFGVSPKKFYDLLYNKNFKFIIKNTLI